MLSLNLISSPKKMSVAVSAEFYTPIPYHCYAWALPDPKCPKRGHDGQSSGRCNECSRFRTKYVIVNDRPAEATPKRIAAWRDQLMEAGQVIIDSDLAKLD